MSHAHMGCSWHRDIFGGRQRRINIRGLLNVSKTICMLSTHIVVQSVLVANIDWILNNMHLTLIMCSHFSNLNLLQRILVDRSLLMILVLLFHVILLMRHV
jgi:hypothetical protein